MKYLKRVLKLKQDQPHPPWGTHSFTWIHWLIAQRIIQIETKKKGTWSWEMLVALALGNVRENQKALNDIKSSLLSMGIPIKAWLLDINEHLYTYNAIETFEPILSKHYLADVATRMWEISAQIFGSSYFTYECLASYLRDPHIVRVKTAVRRLHIITCCPATHRQAGSYVEPIWYGDHKWRWIVEMGADGKCMTAYLSELLEQIKALGEPDERIS